MSNIQHRISCRLASGVGAKYDRELLHEANVEIERLQAVFADLDAIRQREVSTVIICQPNQDFNGQPDEVIEICAPWTNDVALRFSGNSLAECLAAARKRMEETAKGTGQ